MKNDIAQIVHKLRGSIQSCVGFVRFTKDWLERRDESKIDHLVDYCNIAADSITKVLELVEELEEAVRKETEHDQLAKGV